MSKKTLTDSAEAMRRDQRVSRPKRRMEGFVTNKTGFNWARYDSDVYEYFGSNE